MICLEDFLNNRKEKAMQLSIKIDANIYNLLKKIKERDGVPMSVSLSRAVEKYAHEKGVK